MFGTKLSPFELYVYTNKIIQIKKKYTKWFFFFVFFNEMFVLVISSTAHFKWNWSLKTKMSVYVLLGMRNTKKKKMKMVCFINGWIWQVTQCQIKLILKVILHWRFFHAQFFILFFFSFYFRFDFIAKQCEKFFSFFCEFFFT